MVKFLAFDVIIEFKFRCRKIVIVLVHMNIWNELGITAPLVLKLG